MGLSIAALLGLLAANTAQGHLVAKPKSDSTKAIHQSQTKNLIHAQYVCNNGKRLVKKWHCKATYWLRKEWKQTMPVVGVGPMPIDSCTRELLSREGGMNPYATNPSSGAYGGPQALPGSKMSSAGSDWRTNIWTQIKWMYGYMNARYGGSCAALAYHNANGYY